MCPVCPPPVACFCYACGTNHNIRHTVQSPAVVSNRTLAEMPVVVIDTVISCDPDIVRELRAVSRNFRWAGEGYLRSCAKNITAPDRCSSLYNRIRHRFARFNVTSGRDPNCSIIQFYRSIPEEIIDGVIGVDIKCSYKILSCVELSHYNEKQDYENLGNVWKRIHSIIMEATPSVQIQAAKIPEAATDTTKKTIRTWMHENSTLCHNLTRLDLTGLRVRNLPLEIGLCTGLQCLNLSNTCLNTLWEDIFVGMTGLQELNLSSTRLICLPQHLLLLPAGLQRLFLHGNPYLLITWRILPPNENHIHVREMAHAFFNYECKSAFARFYQLVAGSSSAEAKRGFAVRRAFDRLPESFKNAIFRKTKEYMIAEGCRDPILFPLDDPQFLKKTIFSSTSFLGEALKGAISNIFNGLTQEQKNAVYGRVYHLARSEMGAENVDFSDPQWGENHAHDNILRLIDAVSELFLSED